MGVFHRHFRGTGARTLCTKTVPAIPRRPTLRLSGSAQSSDTITISTYAARSGVASGHLG